MCMRWWCPAATMPRTSGPPPAVVWTLKVLGLKELSVLNGGVRAWVAAGLELDPMPEVVQPSTYAPTLDRSLIATREELVAPWRPAARRSCSTHARGLFQRPDAHQAALVPGTLKGAVNVEYTRWFRPDSSEMLGRRGEESGSLGPRRRRRACPRCSFCNTGHWAAINWFALSEVAGIAGREDVPRVDGRMVAGAGPEGHGQCARPPGQLCR
jgi:thiosulfate/3-mercaptopyruvate sulfurtransferase